MENHFTWRTVGALYQTDQLERPVVGERKEGDGTYIVRSHVGSWGGRGKRAR
jgi:hypothetical protein